MTATNTNKQWWVYLVRCADDSYYTGISTDPERRVSEHNNGKGARYTKSRAPVVLAYTEKQPDRSTASKREYQIKQLTHKQKTQLVSLSHSPSAKISRE